MAVYKRGGVWWYHFVFRGERVQESTKQGNKRVAEQMEAARKTQVAKGEAGFAIAPVPLNLAGKNSEQVALVGLGSYLVNAIGDCGTGGCIGPVQFVRFDPRSQ